MLYSKKQAGRRDVEDIRDGPNPSHRSKPMAQATHHHNRFHNLSNEALADALGGADLALKAHEVEVKALKDEFKSRGLLTAAGEHFTVTRSDQVSSRLDVAAVKAFLGDAWRKFEATSITTVIRIKAVQQLAAAA
jgi:hypothetical protein